MPKNKVEDAFYRCQQAVIDKVGVENLDRTIKIGVKVKKIFKNSHELINYLYTRGQRNKFLWLKASDFKLDVDLKEVRCMY